MNMHNVEFADIVNKVQPMILHSHELNNWIGNRRTSLAILSISSAAIHQQQKTMQT